MKSLAAFANKPDECINKKQGNGAKLRAVRTETIRKYGLSWETLAVSTPKDIRFVGPALCRLMLKRPKKCRARPLVLALPFLPALCLLGSPGQAYSAFTARNCVPSAAAVLPFQATIWSVRLDSDRIWCARRDSNPDRPCGPGLSTRCVDLFRHARFWWAGGSLVVRAGNDPATFTL